MDINVKQFVCGEKSFLFARFDSDPGIDVINSLRFELSNRGFDTNDVAVLIGSNMDIVALTCETFKEIGDLLALQKLRDEINTAIYDLERGIS